jgi:hypothetical protein
MTYSKGIGRGGVRPGAGRKSKPALEQQACRRDTVLAVVHDEVWRETVTEWIQTARATKNFGSLYPLLPYILGAAKQEINVTGKIEHVEMQAARKVLRVVGGTG